MKSKEINFSKLAKFAHMKLLVRYNKLYQNNCKKVLGVNLKLGTNSEKKLEIQPDNLVLYLEIKMPHQSRVI